MDAVLITGATGFLGGAITRRLFSNGHQVFATGRSVKKLAALPLQESRKFVWDCRTPLAASLTESLKGVKAIVHCAALSSAWGSDDDFWQANVRATENVLALAKQLRVCHLIHISTPAVYFRFENQFDVSEAMDLPNPVNAYARTKRVAEKKVWASEVPATVLRPRGIYGVGDTALMPRLLRAAKSGALPRFQKGTVVTDITHVDDVVEAVLATLAAGQTSIGEVFNISGGEPRPIVEIVERACAANGVSFNWRDVPISIALGLVKLTEKLARLRKGQPEPRVTAYGLGVFAFSQTLDISEAEKLLGWTPKVTFEDGLKRTFETAEQARQDEH